MSKKAWLLTSEGHEYHSIIRPVAISSTRGKAIKRRADYARDNDELGDTMTYDNALQYTKKCLELQWQDLVITGFIVDEVLTLRH